MRGNNILSSKIVSLFKQCSLKIVVLLLSVEAGMPVHRYSCLLYCQVPSGGLETG